MKHSIDGSLVFIFLMMILYFWDDFVFDSSRKVIVCTLRKGESHIGDIVATIVISSFLFL